MTRSQLRALVSYYLDDLNLGYFTADQVNVWLNNAQKEVQKRLIKAKQNFFVKCVQTNLVVNQNDYILPSDFKDLHRLEIIMSGSPPNETKNPIQPITINQQDLVPNQTGTPQFYFIKKNRLVLYPAPDTALALRLLYTYMIPDMNNDTDVPDLPEDYHELVALLASEDGFLKDGRASELLQKKLAKYEEQLDQDAQQRNLDQPRQIVETGFSSSGEFYW